MIKEEIIPPIFSNSNVAIRLHVDSTHTFYGNPYSSQTAYNLIEEIRQVDYLEETYYVNATYRDVTVMGRNGLAINIPHVSSYNVTGFIIRKIIKLKSNSLSSAMISLQCLTNVDSVELLEIKKALTGINKDSYAFTSVMIDYLITVDDLRNKGNTIYHYQTDTIVSLKDCMEVETHPYSTRFLGIGTFGIKNDYIHQKELNLKIKYINFDSNAAPVYLNILGKVFTVFPQKDAPARKMFSGKLGDMVFEDYLIFFYSTKNDPGIVNGEGVSEIRMTLAEAKAKIGLHTTFQEALNFGNTELVRKTELLTLTHQLEILKQSTAIEKARLDKEDLVRKDRLLEKEHSLELLKKETAQLKQDLELATQKTNMQIQEHKQTQVILDTKLQALDNEKKILDMSRRNQDDKIEREKKEFDDKLNFIRAENEFRLKQESANWKDFYEKRSYERKDSSEVIRFLPGIFLGVIGIATAVIKLSPSKT